MLGDQQLRRVGPFWCMFPSIPNDVSKSRLRDTDLMELEWKDERKE